MATQFTSRMAAGIEETRSRPQPVGEECDAATSQQRSGKAGSKSNSSSKQASVESSRTHSPVIQHTPRKFNGNKNESATMKDLGCEGGEDRFAPLGFEPCGSAENISPFSERSTPPYLEWARDLQYVLNDYEGQDLFRRYLSQEVCCNVLDFYYACTGLNKLGSPDAEKIKDLVLAIYLRYIRPQGEEVLLCVKKECRTQISAEMRMKNYRQSIFNNALLESEEFLRMKHAAFVESEIYLDYVQRIQVGELDSPRLGSDQESHSSSSSTSGDPPRTAAQLLPTVQEELEDTSGRESSQSGSGEGHAKSAGGASKSPPPLPPRRAQSAEKGGNPIQKLRPQIPNSVCGARPKASGKSSAGVGQKDIDPFSVVTQRTLEATVNQRNFALEKNSPGMPPNPYHVKYVPRLPPSTQDSELQSMSSDADSFSMTESTNDFAKRVQLNNHRQNTKERYMKHTQQQQNLEVNLKETIIPRTMQNPPTQRNAHKTAGDRSSFYRELVEKLEIVVREREKEEKLRESLLRLSEPANDSNPRARRDVAEEYSSYFKSVTKNEDDTTILDQHMQQLGWNDSEKASPHRSPGASTLHSLGAKSRPSPGSKSPDRWALGRHMTSSYPSALIMVKNANSASTAEATGYSEASRQQSYHGSSHGRSTMGPPAQDRKQAPTAKMSRPGKTMAASDTSGISSGTSSGASQVSVLIPPQFPETSKSRNKMSAPSHRPSSHKGSSDRLQKGQKVDSASLPRTHKTRRSEGGPWSSVVAGGVGLQSPGQQGQEISVGYYLPNDTAPFVTKVNRNVTLKQFKQLLPKKYQEGSMYKYFFKCASNEFETGGVVQKEVTEDFEILPLWEGKVMAKVVEY